MAQKAILCVDDEAMILFVLKQQLKEYFGPEFIYETAESAEEANEILEDLKKQGIEVLLIISDWLMPGIKGDEFLTSVHKKYPNIGKIMITGQVDKEALDKTVQEAGLRACVLKPWNMDELLSIVEKSVTEKKNE